MQINKKMKVYLGADHAAYELKEELKKFLTNMGYKVIDKGAFCYTPNDDYPDFVIPAAEGAAKSRGKALAIVLGGTGNGECMAANKVLGARAALVYDDYTARMSREHNDANIMCLGSRTATKNFKEAKKLMKIWLETSFSGDIRHQRRIKKIRAFELKKK